MCFYRRITKLSWSEHVSSENVIRKMATKTPLILRNKKEKAIVKISERHHKSGRLDHLDTYSAY